MPDYNGPFSSSRDGEKEMYCLHCGETSLLAAANPKDSRFNETEKEYKQIEMVSSLIRFLHG